MADRLRRASCGLMHRSKGPTLFDHPVRAAEGMGRTIVGQSRVVSQFEFCPRPVSDLAKFASVNGFVDAKGDQNERGCHEHPARMKAARPPKVT